MQPARLEGLSVTMHGSRGVAGLISQSCGRISPAGGRTPPRRTRERWKRGQHSKDVTYPLLPGVPDARDLAECRAPHLGRGGGPPVVGGPPHRVWFHRRRRLHGGGRRAGRVRRRGRAPSSLRVQGSVSAGMRRGHGSHDATRGDGGGGLGRDRGRRQILAVGGDRGSVALGVARCRGAGWTAAPEKQHAGRYSVEKMKPIKRQRRRRGNIVGLRRGDSAAYRGSRVGQSLSRALPRPTSQGGTGPKEDARGSNLQALAVRSIEGAETFSSS